jgi:hypothetical protein
MWLGTVTHQDSGVPPTVAPLREVAWSPALSSRGILRPVAARVRVHSHPWAIDGPPASSCVQGSRSVLRSGRERKKVCDQHWPIRAACNGAGSLRLGRYGRARQFPREYAEALGRVAEVGGGSSPEVSGPMAGHRHVPGKLTPLSLRYAARHLLICCVALAGPVPLQCSIARTPTRVYYGPSCLANPTWGGNPSLFSPPATVVQPSRPLAIANGL